MLLKSIGATVLVAIASIPFANCICSLEGTLGGPHKGKFEVDFTANPNPLPGQAHGSVACNASCQPNVAARCKVNGTLAITNNSSWSVTVNWKGQTGGTPIPGGGGTGQFETGYVTLACGDSKDINFDAGSDGVVAHYQWKCNSCATPPDGA
jgi:hypothetical protein